MFKNTDVTKKQIRAVRTELQELYEDIRHTHKLIKSLQQKKVELKDKLATLSEGLL